MVVLIDYTWNKIFVNNEYDSLKIYLHINPTQQNKIIVLISELPVPIVEIVTNRNIVTTNARFST